MNIGTMTVATLLATAAVGGGLALAQGKPAEQPSASMKTQPTPQQIEGEVTGIDRATGMVTVRAGDGQTHQFRGNADTLQNLKVGDRLELTLRQPAP
jgi:hypothetical protein